MCGNEARLDAVAGEHGVSRDRRPVDNAADAAEKIAERGIRFRRKPFQPGENPFGGIARRREGLLHDTAACGIDHHAVGESPAYVDADIEMLGAGHYARLVRTARLFFLRFMNIAIIDQVRHRKPPLDRAFLEHLVDEQLETLLADAPRSEERRVGKECRSRWAP